METGDKFGKWEIIFLDIPRSRDGRKRVLAQCECGTSRFVRVKDLIRGKSVKCVHCHARESNYKHGNSSTKAWSGAYRSWAGLKQRCLNPKNPSYVNYGGRGIKVCERWFSFENFLEDMGERPEGLSIDRINNDGNYEPGNCRWATQKEQMNNRRAA